MHTTVLFLFVVSTLLIVGLLSYPLISYLRAYFWSNPIQKDLNFQPPVSILIACYNEERYIHERITSLLHPDDWIPGSEILVVSTGSSDGTNSLLETFRENPAVRLFLEERMTKIEALNKLVPLAQHDYLVFSDCRQLMKKGSIKHLVANLNDSSVGTVTCTITDTTDRPSFFRRLFLFLAINDSKTSSTFNLYGALYAQRKAVFRPIPTHLLFDDFFVAVSTLAQNKRLVQEEEAVLYDVPFPLYYNAERIQRLARGLLIFLFNNYALIHAIPWKTRLRLIVYKYLKLVLPLFIVLAIGSSIFLFSDRLNHPSFIVGILIIIGLISAIKPIRNSLLFLIRLSYYFLAALWGYAFLNQRSKYWEPLKIRRNWFVVKSSN